MQWRKVAIVPIGGSKVDIEVIGKRLKDIYLPYGLEWDIREDATFTDMSWAGP